MAPPSSGTDKLYFVWSGWPGFTDGQQNLYIAEMRNPWTLRTDRVLLSSSTVRWEMHGLPINEGPQILIQDGKLHIIYSASGFWTPQYALGRLTYNGTGSLLNAASWTKVSQPVFAAANGVVGVGHASFTVSPDASEHWIVYHAHRNPIPSQGEIRDIRIQQFTFFTDGTPNFGTPLPPEMPMLAPSEGTEPERAFVAGDFNADGLVNTQDYDTWQSDVRNRGFCGNKRRWQRQWRDRRGRHGRVAAFSCVGRHGQAQAVSAAVPTTGVSTQADEVQSKC